MAEGKIRGYGWSTNDPVRARIFADGEHCLAIEHHHNILHRNNEMVQLCRELNLTSKVRGPLAMEMLSGKFTRDTKFPPDDVRSWDLDQDRFPAELEMVDTLRDVLTMDGRSMTQAALGWLWACGDHIVPIPGFMNVGQVDENVGAIQYGILSDEQMRRIDQILGVVDKPNKYDVRYIFG